MKLTQLRRALTDYLVCHDIHAVSAWENQPRQRHPKPVVVVSLQSMAGDVDPRRYLGEQFDTETASLREVYGQRLQLVFSLQLYAPKGEAEGCLSLFDQIAEALALECPEGMAVETLTCGSLSYDRDADLLTCPCTLQCNAWMYAVYDDDGILVSDFIVKGTMV